MTNLFYLKKDLEMGVRALAFFAALSVLAYGIFNHFSKPVKKVVIKVYAGSTRDLKVTIPDSGYFGRGNPKPDDSVKPFKIHVPDETLQARCMKGFVPIMV